MFFSRLGVGIVALGSALAFASPELERELVLTPLGGDTPAAREIARRQAVAEKTPSAAAFEQLGWAFVANARCTQDAGYYKLAEKTAAMSEAHFGATPGTQLLRGHVLHNLHRFAAAEAIARGLVAQRGAPADYALLSDTLMEQGKLGEAIGALQRVLDANPGVEALTRVTQLRWLKGDLEGAVAAMESARRASDARAGESHAWILVRLSGFALQKGDARGALQWADAALACVTDYPPAHLARGRALIARENPGRALPALERAVELNPLPEYQWWLADALRLAGQPDAAAHVEARIKAHGASADPRTCALFLATRGADAALAVRLAREELGTRADPLTLDALAWALAAAGDFDAAADASRLALAEKTRDARLFFHAAAIAVARGDADAARTHARAAQPFALTLTPSERRALETLCFQPTR